VSETFLQGACIIGSNATLAVAFSIPVSTFQFGLEANSNVPIAAMANVTLLNGVTTVTVVPLGSSQTDTFAEAQFTYGGGLWTGNQYCDHANSKQ
jgi:hypothetical protein